MKSRKFSSLCLAAVLALGLVGCGNKSVTLQIGQVNYAAHGTKAFAVVSAVVKGDEIVSAYIDEYQYMDAETSTGVANSEGLAANLVEGKVLGSKRQNNEAYSKSMAEKAGSTVAIADNFDAIQDFVKGKKISELEELVGKTTEEVVDAVSGATLADTQGYIKAVIEAAKQAEGTTGVEFTGKVENLTLSQLNYAAHGTKAFALTSVLASEEEVVLAYVDEYQYLDAQTSTGVANSEALAVNLVEGKVLGSKKENNEAYSKYMAEKAGSTVTIADNFAAIEGFVQGKKIAELEELTAKTPEEVVDAVTGATLVDTKGYISNVIEATK